MKNPSEDRHKMSSYDPIEPDNLTAYFNHTNVHTFAKTFLSNHQWISLINLFVSTSLSALHSTSMTSITTVILFLVLQYFTF